MARKILKVLGVLWALPYTLIGLTIGLIGLCSGGRAQIRRSVIEFYGGFVTWFVTHLPLGDLTMAFTLGHTVLGRSATALDVARDHELVHVRQFERWGPFMGPAYLLSSLVLWLMGKRPYRDNPFERQAYDETDGR